MQNKIILQFQFPEESSVDENDKLCWGFLNNDSSGSICSEIENAFHASQVESSSSYACSITPTKLPYNTLPSLSLSSPNSETSLSPFRTFKFPPFPIPKKGHIKKMIKSRVNKKSSFGSVTSETNSEGSGYFFYI